MDITWPTSHRVGQQSLQDVAQRTYLGRLIPRQPTEVPSGPNGNLLRSMAHSGWGVTEERGRCQSMVGRLDDGHAFERDYWYCVI